MSGKKKVLSNYFKVKVKVEAIKGFKTTSALVREYEVHPNVIGL